MQNKDRQSDAPIFIHPTAIVEDGAALGPGCKIWHFAHVRSGARLGAECIVGKSAYIDSGVKIGERCKIQNNVSVFHGVKLGNGVFVGPHVCFTNDKFPRAVRPNGMLKSDTDWTISETKVEDGASIGANSTIVAGITLGQWCMVGAGALVTKSVPPFALVYGAPACLRGIISPSGKMLSRDYLTGEYICDGEEVPVKILPAWVPEA